MIIKTILCMLAAPPVAWLFWFVFCTNLFCTTKLDVYIFLGPGCEFGGAVLLVSVWFYRCNVSEGARRS